MTIRATLALSVALASAPSLAAAQGRVPMPASGGRIAITRTTPPAPPTHGGMGTSSPFTHYGYSGRLGWRNVRGRWILPYATEANVASDIPAPYAVPVPVVYRVAAPPPEAPRPAPPPYDPRKASIRVIGGGADGGGGVLRLARVTPDSLRIVWLGEERPVSEARLFVADGAYQPLRSVLVTDGRREGRFRLTNGHDAIEYAGVAIVHTDGSRKTVLVPLRDVH